MKAPLGPCALAKTIRRLTLIIEPSKGPKQVVALDPERLEFYRDAELVTDEPASVAAKRIIRKHTGRETLELRVTGMRVKKPA